MAPTPGEIKSTKVRAIYWQHIFHVRIVAAVVVAEGGWQSRFVWTNGINSNIDVETEDENGEGKQVRVNVGKHVFTTMVAHVLHMYVVGDGAAM